VVTSYFGEPRQNGTSHKVWKMPWAGDPRVNMQKGKSGLAKDYQVRQAVQAIDRLIGERPAKKVADREKAEPKTGGKKKKKRAEPRAKRKRRAKKK
jgi:hypothetical protein